MDGVTAEVIDHGSRPKGHVDVEIIFPENGPVTFPIYYRTNAQADVARYRANEVVTKLREYIKERKVRVALDTAKAVKSALLAQLNNL